MNNIFKRAICLILSAILFAAIAVYAVEPVVAASETINYVSLGDSYSNGYGLDSGNSGSFASLFGNKMKNVKYTQLAYAGMRPADIYYILNPEASRDSYSSEVLANVSADKSSFETAITNADIITLNLGYSNLGNFIKRRLPYKNLGLTDLYSSTCDTDTLDNLLDKFEKTVNVDELSQQVSELMAALDGDDIVSYIYGKNTGALTVDGFSNILLHSYVSFAAYYKLLIEKIYALNPDVELIVLGVKNITDGLKVTCGSTTYDADKVFNALANLENLYMASFTNKEKYYFVDVNSSGMTVNNYIDELKTYNTTGNLSDLSQSLVNRIIESTFDKNCEFLGVNIAETISDGLKKLDESGVSMGDVLALFCIDGIHVITTGMNDSFKKLLNNPSKYITADNIKNAFNNLCYKNSFDLTRQNKLLAAVKDMAEFVSRSDVLLLFKDIKDVKGFFNIIGDECFSAVKSKFVNIVSVQGLDMSSDEFLVLVYTILLKIVARAVSLESVNADDILQTAIDYKGDYSDVVTLLFTDEVSVHMNKKLTDEQRSGGMGAVDLFARYYFLDGLCSHPNASGNSALADAAYNAHTSASSRTDYDGLTQNISAKDGSSVKDILTKYSFKLNILGDLNGDKAINIFDAILLKKNIGSTDSKYDINDDKSVTIADLQALMEMILSFEN